MASPQVTGVAACLATGKERFTQEDFIGYLQNHSVLDDMTFDVAGGGYVPAGTHAGVSRFPYWLQRVLRTPSWLRNSFLGGILGNIYGVDIDNSLVDIGTSFDPNDIIGPAGVGDENWLTSPQTLPYTIRFENDPEKADAPAVFVTVTQQLDSNLDWNSFELGNFGFGDINIEIPPGYQNYTERIDLTETIGYFVDFNAEMNAETGAVKYTLETIDPETGEYPTDFDAGFLPPNVKIGRAHV